MLKLSLEKYTKINELTEKWHNNLSIEIPLSKFLNFSEEEYTDFVAGNFEIEYDHDYRIEIKFEDATMRKKNYDQQTCVTTIFPSFPSVCKLSLLSQGNSLFSFESIGFNFGCLGFLNKPDIVNWFENGYNEDYNKFIKFKLTSIEYIINE